MASRRTTDLQIRGIPVTLRDRLRRRATRKGLSMSQYVTEMLESELGLPTIDEWLDEVAALPKVDLGRIDTAELMRDLDEERTEELIRRTSFSMRRSRSTS
jgi:post-segregation antitoxin (ccd killing protein)